MVKTKAPCGEKYPISLGGCPSWPNFPMVDAEAKYGLKGDDVSIAFLEFIDVAGCKLAIIVVGMPYNCSF